MNVSFNINSEVERAKAINLLYFKDFISNDDKVGTLTVSGVNCIIRNYSLIDMVEVIKNSDNVTDMEKKFVSLSQVYIFFYEDYPLYIGKSNGDTVGRLKQHIYGKANGNEDLYNILKNNRLRYDSFSVSVIIITSVLSRIETQLCSESTVVKVEQGLIKINNPLCNKAHCDNSKTPAPPFDLNIPFDFVCQTSLEAYESVASGMADKIKELVFGQIFNKNRFITQKIDGSDDEYLIRFSNSNNDTTAIRLTVSYEIQVNPSENSLKAKQVTDRIKPSSMRK